MSQPKRFRLHPVAQHLLFWLGYCFFVSTRDLVYHPYIFNNLLTSLFLHAPIAPLIYLNLYVLVPRLLLRKQTLWYLLSLGGVLLLSVMISQMCYVFLFGEVYGLTERVQFFSSHRGQIVIFTEMLLLNFVSMALFFIQQWYVKDRYAQELERKNLEGELQWLKHQIQPHFLFNTLNAIYMLMDRKADLAQRVLLRFSEMLSHQLYDARQDRITLEKELHYLENYLQIEALRNEGLLTLTYELPDEGGDRLIAPMMLIPFVENAFKHGRSSNGYWVRLQLAVRGETLYMRVSNSRPNSPRSTPDTASGIGLANVRRRLELIYPGQHTLNLSAEVDTFTVSLTLPLEQAPAVQPAPPTTVPSPQSVDSPTR